MYFSDFKLLTEDRKISVLMSAGVWSDSEDDVSVDSVMTPRSPKCYEVMKVACNRWKSMSRDLVGSWKERAARLNMLPIQGKFNDIPYELNTTSLEDNIKTSLTLDWAAVVKFFRNFLIRKSRNGESKRVLVFGKERVQLRSQVYRAIHLNYLLKLTLFGSEFSNLFNYEVIERTKKQVLIHLASKRRVNEILSIYGLSASSHHMNGIDYCCCAKVNAEENNRSITGYVIDEDMYSFTLRLETNEIAMVSRPSYDAEQGIYCFGSGWKGCNLVITEYCPVRLKINNSGHIVFTINRIAFDDSDKLVINIF